MAVLFARFKVTDLSEFEAVHSETRSAHAKHNISETVWQDADDSRSITIAIRGSRNAIDAWRNSEERSALVKRLRLESAGESWLAKEIFAEGEYER